MRVIIKCQQCKKDFVENAGRPFSEHNADSDSREEAETRCPRCGKEIKVRVNFWTDQ